MRRVCCHLTAAVFVLASAHAAQLSDASTQLSDEQLSDASTWPAWLKAWGGRKHSADTKANVTPSGGNSTNVAQNDSSSTNATMKASATEVPAGEGDGLDQGVSTQLPPTDVAQSDSSSTNATIKASATTVPAGEGDGPAQGVSTQPAPTEPHEEDPRQESESLPAQTEALSRPGAAAAQADSAIGEPAARSGGNSTGGKGGWRSWFKKWRKRKRTVDNSTEPISAAPKLVNLAKINTTKQESGSPSPASSQTTSRSAAAVGDPHLQNIHGERFDLMRPGKHVLIQIPRKQRVENEMLRVEARVRRLGDQCADLYFQEVNITGAWVPHGRTGGLHFQAQGARDEHAKWLQLGKVRVKVVHGHTTQGYKYLNFYVKDLGRVEFPIGGLLGEDDHTEAAMPLEACAHRLSLIQVAATTDQGAPIFSLAEASLA